MFLIFNNKNSTTDEKTFCCFVQKTSASVTKVLNNVYAFNIFQIFTDSLQKMWVFLFTDSVFQKRGRRKNLYAYLSLVFFHIHIYVKKCIKNWNALIWTIMCQTFVFSLLLSLISVVEKYFKSLFLKMK